ncbi:MAG: hypothetical protein RBR67_05025 [Desulfobacterium sp.]|jgi:hypothetical protein|nr:hypothetical protein [Desulfobacterium sp.]
MNNIFKSIVLLILFSLVSAGITLADSEIPDHDMSSSGKIGDLFHESVVDGYMLSYYLLDLREQTGNGSKEMDKPHHIMVYIMDKQHRAVLKGTVGFMIKGPGGTTQKAMAMYMSEGFGITADMRNKGVYTITAKALVGDSQLVDRFTHGMR